MAWPLALNRLSAGGSTGVLAAFFQRKHRVTVRQQMSFKRYAVLNIFVFFGATSRGTAAIGRPGFHRWPDSSIQSRFPAWKFSHPRPWMKNFAQGRALWPDFVWFVSFVVHVPRSLFSAFCSLLSSFFPAGVTPFSHFCAQTASLGFSGQGSRSEFRMMPVFFGNARKRPAICGHFAVHNSLPRRTGGRWSGLPGATGSPPAHTVAS